MNHTTMRLWIVAALIACLILVSFLVSISQNREAFVSSSASSSAPIAATTTPSVTLHDSFKRGVHTISGTVTTPDACVVPMVDASLQGNASSTQSIRVAISLPEDTSVCLQLPTEAPFSTTIPALADLPITVTVNGVLATTTP